MKTALVCIARNEDFYIDEWIKYHTKLGFDYIYVYQNNWRYNGDKTQYNNVHWFEFDGQAKQVEAYNNFVIYHHNEYDWAAFFDIDEYLILKNTTSKNINEELAKFNDIKVLGIPWRIFGSNNKKHPSIDNNYSLVDRFTKSSSTLSTFKKLFINFNMGHDSFRFHDPHYLKNEELIVDTTKTINTTTSLFPDSIITSINQTMELNHYMLLNFDERCERKSCGDVFYGDEHRKNIDMIQEFNWWKSIDDVSNQIDNMYAYNFKHKI